MSLHDLLPFFNRSGPVYRALIGDEERSEFPIISGINDINRGAMENALEWHLRFQRRAVRELNIREATGVFLRIWSKLTGIERPSGLTDPDFAEYIIRQITSGGSSVVQVFAALPDSDFDKFPEESMGAFSDMCYADAGPIRPEGAFHASSVVTWENDPIFCVVRSEDVITTGLCARLRAALAAGTAVYVAVLP